MEEDDLGDIGDEDYFSSYEDLEETDEMVHRLMLTDQPRTETYQKAILSNKNVFENKVVMDVGAGTGILSFFCAQAGAKKVYAIEASSIAQTAQKLVEANNFSHIIEVINSRVEDIVLPDNEKVDVIVSEWMGFYLFHEGMLDSVLAARDTHLKLGGKIFPQFAKVYACPCSLPQIYGFWNDVYGVNMEILGEEIRKSKGNQPEITLVKQEDLLSKPACLLELDLSSPTLTSKALDTITLKHVTGTLKDGDYQGVCMWFDCVFPSESEELSMCVSTSPAAPPTHWKQTVIVLPNSYAVEEGEPIAWQIELSRNSSNDRQYSIEFKMLDAEKEKHPVPCDCHMTKCIVIRTFLETEAENIEATNDNEIIDMA